MTILITGGAGFIGTNFVFNYLNQRNNNLIVYDKLTYAGNKENFKTLKNSHRFKFITWLYSSHKRNFFTTISKLIKTKDCIKVVNDQIGSPTLVDDLVDAVLIILNILLKEKLNKKNKKKIWGIYNLSNSGETSWYKFASLIADKMGYNAESKIIPINSKDYNSVADRPLNSKLDNSKIFDMFGIRLPNWEDSFNNFFKNNTKEF